MNARKQTGFGVVEVIIVLVVIGIIGFIGYQFWSRASENNSKTASGNSVCYRASESYYCYDTTTKQHRELKETQLGSLKGEVWISPARDASKYLVADTTQTDKATATTFYLADSKLQNLQKLKDLDTLSYLRSVAWKPDASGFYFVATDPAYPDPTASPEVGGMTNPPSQIFSYDLSSQTAVNLTKNKTNVSYSNPIVSQDGKILIVLRPVDIAALDIAIVSLGTDGSNMVERGRLGQGYGWDTIVAYPPTNSIVATKSPQTKDPSARSTYEAFGIADLLKDKITPTELPSPKELKGSFYGTVGNVAVYHHFEDITWSEQGFDVVDEAGQSAYVKFQGGVSGDLLFVLSSKDSLK